MKTTTIHEQKYVAPSWDELGHLVFTLSQKIIESGLEFDRIVALAKGGLTFSRTLVDYLGMKELSSIQIEFYNSIYGPSKTPVIIQSLPISIRNERILLFDEVVDSGETMKMAIQYMNYHGCKSVHTASVGYKPWSSFKVDFHAFETDAWILFPHENRESIHQLTEMWQKRGDSATEIEQHLLEVGLPKPEVEFFSKIR